jgi:LCP family protein required for cell wall assembly
MSESRVDSPGAPAAKARSPLWAKILVGVGAVLLVGAGGGAVYANTLLNQINNSVEDADLLGDGDREPGEEIKGPLNMLMIGTDMRVNDDDGVDRADSIMILHVNEDLTKANIVSIPRDLKVSIDSCNGGGPCEDRINAAYEAGGDTREERFTNLAVTLTGLTGIEHFDAAAIVGFEGFLKAVKTMGSIELCLPIDMQLEQEKLEDNSGRVFKKGCDDYNSQEALWIVRERYAYDPANPDFDPSWGVGDYGRQHMQQHFIKQLLKKAGEEGYITDPSKVGALIQDIGSTMTLDLNGSSVSDFAVSLRHIEPSALETVRLPSSTSVEYGADGAEIDYEVIAPQDEETAEALFKAIRDDTMDEWMKDNPDLLNKD